MTHRKKFMLTLWHLFAIATLITSFLMVGLTAYWTLLPVQPGLEVTNIKIETPTVTSGDSVRYSFDYCKKSPTTRSQANVSIVDGSVVQLPAIFTNRPAGCAKNVQTEIKVPKYLYSGTYHLEISVTYTYNPLNTKTFHYRTPDFQVVNKVGDI